MIAMANQTDLPFMKPLKGIINEQITALFTFQSEIRSEIRMHEARQTEYEYTIESLKKNVHKIHEGMARDGEEIQELRRSISPIDVNERYQRSGRNLTSLTNRSGLKKDRKNSRGDLQGDNRASKIQDPSYSNVTEMLVDQMKLQNILNFEQQKSLNQLMKQDQDQVQINNLLEKQVSNTNLGGNLLLNSVSGKQLSQKESIEIFVANGNIN